MKDFKYNPNLFGTYFLFRVSFIPGSNSLFSYFSSNITLSIFCGTDKFFRHLNNNFYIIYMGSFKNNNFIYGRANLILPVLIHVEYNGSFINLEGKVKKFRKAINSFKFIFSITEAIGALFLYKHRLSLSNFSRLTNFSLIMFFFSNIINYYYTNEIHEPVFVFTRLVVFGTLF